MKKKYQIKVSYQTGDSFHNEDTETIVELSWNSIEVAKQNLKRIEEHGRWYENKSSRRPVELPAPSFMPNKTNHGLEHDSYDSANTR